jgi:hypothetical protein
VFGDTFTTGKEKTESVRLPYPNVFIYTKLFKEKYEKPREIFKANSMKYLGLDSQKLTHPPTIQHQNQSNRQCAIILRDRKKLGKGCI